ncbi:hypothetical protein [Xanthomonas phage X1]|nr:hypothetical protein [Xanthomonas phage X1]
MILAKWALVLVMISKPTCGGTGCVPSVSQTTIPVETKELCLQQANYLSQEVRKLEAGYYYTIQSKAYCIQVAK